MVVHSRGSKLHTYLAISKQQPALYRAITSALYRAITSAPCLAITYAPCLAITSALCLAITIPSPSSTTISLTALTSAGAPVRVLVQHHSKGMGR